MYILYKYNEWPHRILIKFNDKIIASTDRWYSSARFNTAEDADTQFENIAQLTLLEQLVERANAGIEQEERHAED